jgi:hypothetical protein
VFLVILGKRFSRFKIVLRCFCEMIPSFICVGPHPETSLHMIVSKDRERLCYGIRPERPPTTPFGRGCEIWWWRWVGSRLRYELTCHLRRIFKFELRIGFTMDAVGLVIRYDLVSPHRSRNAFGSRNLPTSMRAVI